MSVQLSDFQKKVFDDRYALKDENGKQIEFTPEEMWQRVARCVAQAETSEERRKYWTDEFFKTLENWQFVPGGRILSAAGNEGRLTFYNCFVIPSPEDSRAGILDNVKLMVEIMSRSGGVGVNLSTLRPRGSYVKGVNGSASGAVSFGGLYSYATGLITQGGSRRGALMLMLNDDHPDIEEFITVKRKMGLVTNANLSVCVSDHFMEALKNDADWDLQWGSRVYKTIKASYLWNLICESAHASGEPGLFFIERANKQSNTWYFEKLISTNPCVTGDTKVHTRDGLKLASELYESDRTFEVVVDSRLHDAKFSKARAIKTGKKQVYKLTTKEGYELKLTKDHKVRTVRGFVPAGELKREDKILILNQGNGFGNRGDLETGKMLGWFVGDGHLTATKGATLSFFGEEKRELALVFARIVNTQVVGVGERAAIRTYPIGINLIKGRDEARVSSLRLATVLATYGLHAESELIVPEAVFEGTKDMQKGFLQGLFSAGGQVSGTIEKGASVRVTSIRLELLQDVQRVLLNFGIASKIYQNRRTAGWRSLPNHRGGNQEYFCQAQHDLVVSKVGLVTFAREIGFLSETKNNRLQMIVSQFLRGPYVENFTATFEKLVKLGKEDVYDLIVPGVNAFSANGIVVHNCGEQPLGAWSVCNLGAMNLSAFVNEFGVFDEERLRRAVRIAMRFLDNVIDVTYYPYPQNEEAQKNIRRTGLGTMGLADALIKLKIRYASAEARAWCERVYAIIRDEAYRASVEIAAEKTPFPKFDREKYLQGYFIRQLPADIQAGIERFGIRNAVVLTQAPTGTTSAVSGVSSGIEPVYDFVTIRRDRLGEHELLHPLYANWVSEHGQDAALPSWFATAKDLTPEEHVETQAVIQKYTDSSISKTVNAPEFHTIEAVRTLYIKAYELGCKGVTYFRENSRDEAVLYSKNKESGTKNQESRIPVLERVQHEAGKNQESKVYNSEPKEINDQAPGPAMSQSNGSNVGQTMPRPRPEVVHGSTYKVKTGYGTLFVTVNNDEHGKPFEVFANIGKAGGFFSAKSESICRLVSLALRSGVGPEIVIDQLRGIRGPMPCWNVKYGQVLSIPDALAHVIEEHLGGKQGKLDLGYPSFNRSEGSEAMKEDKVLTAAGAKELPPTNSVPVNFSIADRGFAPECPDCGHLLYMTEGCMSCAGCGYSKCG